MLQNSFSRASRDKIVPILGGEDAYDDAPLLDVWRVMRETHTASTAAESGQIVSNLTDYQLIGDVFAGVNGFIESAAQFKEVFEDKDDATGKGNNTMDLDLFFSVLLRGKLSGDQNFQFLLNSTKEDLKKGYSLSKFSEAVATYAQENRITTFSNSKSNFTALAAPTAPVAVTKAPTAPVLVTKTCEWKENSENVCKSIASSESNSNLCQTHILEAKRKTKARRDRDKKSKGTANMAEASVQQPRPNTQQFQPGQTVMTANGLAFMANSSGALIPIPPQAISHSGSVNFGGQHFQQQQGAGGGSSPYGSNTSVSSDNSSFFTPANFNPHA